MNNQHHPTAKCSIILPTYNRASFLPEAISAICKQQFTDWQLIIIDDGSTDNTRQIIDDLTSKLTQPVVYHYQKNAGAYGARNTGLDLADGQYIAFYDSDDLWLPHHLSHCIDQMERHTEVDWVYGACRKVDMATGKTFWDNTFYYTDGTPREFLAMQTQDDGDLHIVEDRHACECAIRFGFYNGLQNSVIRQKVFEGYRFNTAYRNEAEDQLFAIRAHMKNFTISYLNDIHVIYRVHQTNSSSSAKNASIQHRLFVTKAMIQGFEELLEQTNDTHIKQVIRLRLVREYFWTFGYGLLWCNGYYKEALQTFSRSRKYWMGHWRCWKTFAASWIKSLVLKHDSSLPAIDVRVK